MAVNPAANKIYVTNFNTSNMTVIDGTTNDTTLVTVDSLPCNVAVNPATNKIYIANLSTANSADGRRWRDL